jgi:hypothetical protein
LFPIVHAYAIQRLVGRAGPLHLLGAIFPDAVLVNGLDWGQAHQSGGALYAYLQEHAPAGLPFALGVISHGIVPAGLDYYGDRQYGPCEHGYAFEEARPYADRVAAICHLPPEMGWWKAHNFVEMALEWLVARRHPALGGQLQQALVQAPDLAGLSPHLAAFFDRPGLDLMGSFPAMVPFLSLEDIAPASLAERYQRQVQLKHGVEAIEVAQAAALLEEVAAAIQPRCWEFLDDALGRIEGMIRAAGWHSPESRYRPGAFSIAGK